MKKIFLPLAVLLTTTINAQVGINTDNPKATLDISANPDGTIAVPSGLLIPRITRVQAANVTTSPPLITTPVESTLIYINDISGAMPTNPVAMDIDAKGYYYYSAVNQKWTKIANNPDGTSNFDFDFDNGLTPITSGNKTIVELGGTLTKNGNTVIEATTRSKLNITGDVTNAFSVGENTFSVDGATNNVGIGTTSPQNKLQVNGNIQLSGSLNVGAIGAGDAGTEGQYLVSKGPNTSPVWSSTGPNGTLPNPIALDAENGITDIEVGGNHTIKLGGTITEYTQLDINGGKLLIQNGGVNAFSVGDTNLSVDNNNNRVGIGTKTPTNKLHIKTTGTDTTPTNTTGAIRIQDGTQVDGYVLTSDGDGVGTWKPLPTATPLTASNGLDLDEDSNTLTLGGTLNKNGNTVIEATASSKLNITGNVINAFSVGGSNFSVDNLSNNVGIGTTSPDTKLHVNGQIKITGGSPGEGKVLTSSNNAGLATWVSPSNEKTTATNGLSKTTSNDLTTVKLGGNLSENTTIDTYPPGGVRYNLQLVGLADADATDTGILMVDANNNVRKTTNLSNDLRIPEPAVFELQTEMTNFLNNKSIGEVDAIPFKTIVNAIDEITPNTNNNQLNINFRPGIYQFTVVYEATFPESDNTCTLSSYIVDFPVTNGGNQDNGTSQRIHSTAAHAAGAASNHGGTISFTTVLTEARDWTANIGLGQSGNCDTAPNNHGNPKLKLVSRSTQMTILRMGDAPPSS